MLAQAHLKQLQSLLSKGYTSQLLFCSQLPLSIKIPSLISCRMYDEAIVELLKQQNLASPLHILWLVICCHMVDTNYDEYYELLEKEKESKYKELADDWIKLYKPVVHPVEVKNVMRKKFQELLLLAQEENYFSTAKMPVFLVSCSWLQKFYNNNLAYIPPVDNSPLYTPMPYIETEPKHLHYNYKLSQTCRQNIDYKIIPFQAWQYLYTNFGGMEFRRFTTNQKEPICQLSYVVLRVVVVENRCLFGLRLIQVLVGRFDTLATVIERVKRIMVAYGIIQFQSLNSKWEPILVSHLQFDQLVNIIQDQQRDLIKQSSSSTHQLHRLQYNHDIQDSQYNPVSNILLLTLHKPPSPCFLDLHSIPYKKTTKQYNKCQTCSATEQLEQCVCKQVYFCCKECRAKNKEHLKICQDLMKEDIIVDRLVDLYGVQKRVLQYGDVKKGGKVGLENLGNTCYMNAALQCVLTVDVLNQFFLSNQHVKQLNVTNVLGSAGNLACAYGEFVKDYFTTNRKALEPIKILKIISGKNAQFRGHNHQDSQQFFNYFFDKLHEDLNRIRDKPYVENIESDGRPDAIVSDLSWRNYLKRNNSFISQNFAGQYRSQIRCPDCERISITFDPFLSVTLPFPKQEPMEQLTGYYLNQEGGFQKVDHKVKASMPGEEFLQTFFHEPVYPLWLRKKQPESQWKMKKSVSYNNSSKGVLIFYSKPVDSTVQIQVKYENFDIFHRKIFTTSINSLEDLMKILHKQLKTPILRATKNDELIKMSTEDFVKACEQSKFLQIVDNSITEYPFEKGVTKIKLNINKDLIPWPLTDIIKFDISSKHYEPKTLFKSARSINDKISVGQLLESFSQPQQLTQQNSWYCNKCKDHKLAQKIMSVYKTAKYLVIHLKRFNHRGNRFIIYGEKVRTPIELQNVEMINGQKYELFGVVNHYGSLSMGHYTAYVNRDGQWYHADDSSFRRREVDGDDAYLLFYRRIQ